jgi:hypothetical protein
VASYHKAKGEHADMARELEVARGKTHFLVTIFFLWFSRLTALALPVLQLPLP